MTVHIDALDIPVAVGGEIGADRVEVIRVNAHTLHYIVVLKQTDLQRTPDLQLLVADEDIFHVGAVRAAPHNIEFMVIISDRHRVVVGLPAVLRDEIEVGVHLHDAPRIGRIHAAFGDVQMSVVRVIADAVPVIVHQALLPGCHLLLRQIVFQKDGVVVGQIAIVIGGVQVAHGRHQIEVAVFLVDTASLRVGVGVGGELRAAAGQCLDPGGGDRRSRKTGDRLSVRVGLSVFVLPAREQISRLLIGIPAKRCRGAVGDLLILHAPGIRPVPVVGNEIGLQLPLRVERHCRPVGIGEILHPLQIPVSGAGAVRRGIPAAENAARPPEAVRQQGPAVVHGHPEGCHGTGAAVRAEGNAVDIALPDRVEVHYYGASLGEVAHGLAVTVDRALRGSVCPAAVKISFFQLHAADVDGPAPADIDKIDRALSAVGHVTVGGESEGDPLPVGKTDIEVLVVVVGIVIAAAAACLQHKGPAAADVAGQRVGRIVLHRHVIHTEGHIMIVSLDPDRFFDRGGGTVSVDDADGFRIGPAVLGVRPDAAGAPVGAQFREISAVRKEIRALRFRAPADEMPAAAGVGIFRESVARTVDIGPVRHASGRGVVVREETDRVFVADRQGVARPLGVEGQILPRLRQIRDRLPVEEHAFLRLRCVPGRGASVLFELHSADINGAGAADISEENGALPAVGHTPGRRKGKGHPLPG